MLYELLKKVTFSLAFSCTHANVPGSFVFMETSIGDFIKLKFLNKSYNICKIRFEKVKYTVLKIKIL